MGRLFVGVHSAYPNLIRRNMKKVPKDKTKVGRPRLNIDGEKISKWISYGATVREIADVENCSEDHIHTVFRDNITKGK